MRYRVSASFRCFYITRALQVPPTEGDSLDLEFGKAYRVVTRFNSKTDNFEPTGLAFNAIGRPISFSKEELNITFLRLPDESQQE